MFYRGQPDQRGRPAQQTPVITITPPAEELSDPMDVGEPGPGTSAFEELSEETSGDSGTSLQIVLDEPCLRLPIRPRGSESLRKLSSQTKKVLNKKEKIYS